MGYGKANVGCGESYSIINWYIFCSNFFIRTIYHFIRMYELLGLLYLQFELHSKFWFTFIVSFPYRTLNKLKLISSARRIAQTQSSYLLWRVNSSEENTVIENVHQLKVLREFSGFLIYFISNPLSRVFAEISFEFNFIFSRKSHPRVFIIFRIPIRR